MDRGMRRLVKDIIHLSPESHIRNGGNSWENLKETAVNKTPLGHS